MSRNHRTPQCRFKTLGQVEWLQDGTPPTQVLWRKSSVGGGSPQEALAVHVRRQPVARLVCVHGAAIRPLSLQRATECQPARPTLAEGAPIGDSGIDCALATAAVAEAQSVAEKRREHMSVARLREGARIISTRILGRRAAPFFNFPYS